jgi:predicted ribosomally synthesized peptide with nif11-like leader
MSKEIVKKMYSQIEENADLMKKYVELIETLKTEASDKFFDKFIELGKASGFVFSKDDILAADSESRELSDDELSNVAGGIFDFRPHLRLK